MEVSTLPGSATEPAACESASASPRIQFQEAALAAISSTSGGPHAYWRAVLQHGSEGFAPNLKSRPGWIRSATGGWPLTVHDGPCGNSFPASLLTQYVDYPRAELDLLGTPSQRLAARLGLLGLAGLLRIARADRVAQWNSWLLSTNLPPAGTTAATQAITLELARQFPDYAILLKTVDPSEDPDWIPTLRQAGYVLMTSRQVYHFDGRTGEFRTRSTVKRDLKEFARDTRYRWVGPTELSAADAPRITELYQRLYLEKHSRLNPQYTESFVRRALREHWLEFHGIRRSDGVLMGAFGFFTLGQTTSVPFIGYDTSLPQEEALYRRLVSGMLQIVADREQHLNYSSGAGDFKLRRGAVPVIEYNAVYCAHLPRPQRQAFSLVAALLNRFVRPWMEQNPH